MSHRPMGSDGKPAVLVPVDDWRAIIRAHGYDDDGSIWPSVNVWVTREDLRTVGIDVDAAIAKAKARKAGSPAAASPAATAEDLRRVLTDVLASTTQRVVVESMPVRVETKRLSYERGRLVGSRGVEEDVSA